MGHIRVAGIIIKDNKILLMERKKDGKHYWVFPGGSVEKGETETNALQREIREETNIEIKIESKLVTMIEKNRQEVYYICSYVTGNVSLPKDSVEQARISKEGQFYKPQWKNYKNIKKLNLLPLFIRDIITDGSFDI